MVITGEIPVVVSDGFEGVVVALVVVFIFTNVSVNSSQQQTQISVSSDTCFYIIYIHFIFIFYRHLYLYFIYISKFVSSSRHHKPALVKTTHIPKKTSKMLKRVINFPKVVQQRYIGEVGKSITFVLFIISVYSVPNIVEIGQHYIKTNRGYFLSHEARGLKVFIVHKKNWMTSYYRIGLRHENPRFRF